MAGEERDLKVRIREMDSRKENVENCMTARMSLVGDGSAGGAEELISVVHSSLKAILSREQSMSSTFPTFCFTDTSHVLASKERSQLE